MATFPADIINTIKTYASLLPGVTTVVKRGLNPTDENGTMGITANVRIPDELEMGRDGFNFFGGEPSLSTWQFTIGHFVKHESEEEAERIHTEVANSLWRMLYQDQAFVVALRGLVDTSGAQTERVQRHWIAAQRLASNEIEGTFVRMSATELNVQIQTG